MNVAGDVDVEDFVLGTKLDSAPLGTQPDAVGQVHAVVLDGLRAQVGEYLGIPVGESCLAEQVETADNSDGDATSSELIAVQAELNAMQADIDVNNIKLFDIAIRHERSNDH